MNGISISRVIVKTLKINIYSRKNICIKDDDRMIPLSSTLFDRRMTPFRFFRQNVENITSSVKDFKKYYIEYFILMKCCTPIHYLITWSWKINNLSIDILIFFIYTFYIYIYIYIYIYRLNESDYDAVDLKKHGKYTYTYT